MPVLAAIRLTATLNHAVVHGTDPHLSTDWIMADDVAHHVIDADGIGSTELTIALRTARLPDDGWVLALPRPGALGPLRGPLPLSRAAMDAGAAVISVSGGTALVPHRVGPALQWEVFDAAAPGLLPSAAEADQLLRHAILEAANLLEGLDLTSGTRPDATEMPLPPGFGARSQKAVVRGLNILTACDAALDDHSEILHAHGVHQRITALTPVRAAAIDAICATVSWGSGVTP
ncbi:hypothetical protein [Propioniferax innocua]|uniref:hypothetical protein n=1 Tax=Propioniferax innocua TaxID=1753 RepID=UPI00114EAF0E|nr:hypothetical protein [Propioniferax innocua]